MKKEIIQVNFAEILNSDKMASPQFDKKATTDRWYSLTYQSNNLLNKEQHNKVKPIIAQQLIKKFSITNIHSYIHGTIIFSINTKVPLSLFSEIRKELSSLFNKQTPKLLFSLSLITQSSDKPPKNYMFIDGDDELDIHFQKAVSIFFGIKK